MGKVVVVILHGVEAKNLPPDYADGFVKRVAGKLPPECRDRFEFVPINWGVIGQERQEKAYSVMESGLPLALLRKAKHTIVSDLLWWTRNKSEVGFYYEVMELIRLTVTHYLVQWGPQTRFVFIAHSWGTQIGMEYLFDSSIRFDGFVTMGSPIGCVSGKYPDWGKAPPVSWWINFWHQDDVVSSPLRSHPSEAVSMAVSDFEVRDKRLLIRLLSWLPNGLYGQIGRVVMAHTCYWGSDYVAEILAANLAQVPS